MSTLPDPEQIRRQAQAFRKAYDAVQQQLANLETQRATIEYFVQSLEWIQSFLASDAYRQSAVAIQAWVEQNEAALALGPDLALAMRNSSVPDAAEQILKANGNRPMSVKELASKMMALGVRIASKRPENSVYTALFRDTKKRFERVDKGTWRLVNQTQQSAALAETRTLGPEHVS
jgi:hypothetical protein